MTYLKFFLALALSCPLIVSRAQIAAPGAPLPPWQPGWLDLHQINTGRGNAAYFVLPDGTTILFDAGEEDPDDKRTVSARNSTIHPNDSKKPYEWIASYIRQAAPAGRAPVVNYAVLSHLHDDHMGAWYAEAPHSAHGDYRLTGIPGVAELIPVETLLDRGYPNYNFPFDMKGAAFRAQADSNASAKAYWRTLDNYFRFVAERDREHRPNGNLRPGSKTQIGLRYQPAKYPDCFVRGIKTNGSLWTGGDTGALRQLFPADLTTDSKAWRMENALSQVMAISYGPFKYYSGGDIPGNVGYGEPPYMDVETPVAQTVGAVDVAVLNHHGNRDGTNENFVRTLHPRVWIDPVWSSDHPGQEVLIRLTTPFLYPGPRDLFAINMLQANRDVIGPALDEAFKSEQGHILVRVLPGGRQYYVIILDDAVEKLTVRKLFGPYDAAVK